MRKLIVLAALVASLCAPAAFGQGGGERTNSPTNLYITSMYKVRVYLNNRVVDVLPAGKRAQIIRSKGNWYYVRYSRGGKYYEGWIRR